MKPFIIANWKCNPINLKEAKLLFNSVKIGLKDYKKAEVIICPPFIYLSSLNFQFAKKKTVLKLGAQDCFWEQKGAYTGEISPMMLKNLGCKYVIIGHSERRKILNEANQSITKKIKAVLSVNLKPILCIGESKDEKENGKTQTVLKIQIENSLKKITKKEIKNIIFAYEPVWAIGTGNSCSVDESHVVRLLIEKIISQKYSRLTAKKFTILYGGSVTSSNVRDFIKEAGFHGVLVGGASLDSKEFIKLTKEF